MEAAAMIGMLIKKLNTAAPSRVKRKPRPAVIVDPDRDTPAALHAFREKHALGTEHWTLLRGTPEATRELAQMVGFNFQPGSPTQFAHSLLISVLNPAGEIVYQHSGLGHPTAEPVAALARSVKAKKKN